jgi:tetratricopeptide (TPR) repeat protein
MNAVEDGLFVGRETERSRAMLAIDRAIAGKPAVLLFAGEAGIGKTRIAEVVAQAAAEKGARVVWGRAWEAGGAPAYWPFIQIFRALDLDDPFASEDTSRVDVAQARFKTFDRAVTAIKNEAQKTPLAIVLDDLHAADLPTLEVLHFLARDPRSAKLIVIGTYRDAEARTSGAGKILGKVARDGETIVLPRLTREDVTSWMKEVAPHAGASDVTRVYETTEGNALFVRELLRVRGAGLGEALPDGLTEMLDEHLARISEETREVLTTASVLGREIDRDRVAALAERDTDTIDRALREGAAAGILTPIAGGERARFVHILLCDRLATSLAPSRRAMLHWRAGEQLVLGSRDRAIAAHHLFAGRAAGSSERASEVCFAAARAAFARLAFEDAARLAAMACEAHAADDIATCEAELLLGEALMRGGDTPKGTATCVTAFERAKRIGSPEHQARAALVYGTEIVTGTVDPTMLRMLEEAIAAFPKEDSVLRAKLLARQAAALVPPRSRDDVPVVFALSDECIAMARRLGDPDTLLYVLHFGGSACGYLISSKKRGALIEEMVTLSDKLDRPLVFLAVGGWWIAQLLEEGRRAEAESTLARYERLLGEFRQPHYQWRAPMMRALFALLDGDIAEAERLGAIARELAEQGAIRAGLVTYVLHRISIAQVRGMAADITAHADLIREVMGRVGRPVSDVFQFWLDAALGRKEHALGTLRKVLITQADGPPNFPGALMGGDAIAIAGDVELAEKLYPDMAYHASQNPFFWGPLGTSIFGPTHRVAGDLARLLGKEDEARRWYEEALALGEKMQARIIVDVAKRRLADLGAPPPSRSPASSSSSPKDIALVREGEMWRLSSSTGVSMHLKDGKGLHYLAELLARPGSELHVTQLAELDNVSNDAAPVLDDRAKRDYKKRVEELEDILEEATRFADQGRIEKARDELDAIAGQLASAVGLGGRDRKMGSQVEKARINVQRRLRDAIQRISEHDPVLGRYLTATIKTGVFCAFTPI